MDMSHSIVDTAGTDDTTTSVGAVISRSLATLGVSPDRESKLVMITEALRIRPIPYTWGGGDTALPPAVRIPLDESELDQAYCAAHEIFFKQFNREMENLGLQGRYWSLSLFKAAIRDAGAEAMVKDMSLAKREYQHLILDHCGHRIDKNVTSYLESIGDVPLVVAVELCAVVEDSYEKLEETERATRELRKSGFRLEELAELPQALRVPAIQGCFEDIASR